jgi:sugar phosphate isomerase/epimerase
MSYPRVYLTLDNCFAVKRWIRPSEWMSVVRDLGVCTVEASTDNECDPFYVGEEHLLEWSEQAAREQERTGLRLVNFCTGYSTYRTVGLLHPDPRVVRRIVEGWIKVMVRVSGTLGAGLGFYLHAFSDSILQDPAAYRRLEAELLDTMVEIVGYAEAQGAGPILLEQMYSPHQTPWTISGSLQYLRQLFRKTAVASYIIIDTGHQVGQKRFRRPSARLIADLRERRYDAQSLDKLWLGPRRVSDRLKRLLQEPAAELERYLDSLDGQLKDFGYLFCEERDSDLYSWLEELGCWAPVVHLQQTDGSSSSHRAFTPEDNSKGIVRVPDLLRALARSYERPEDLSLPPRVENLYLTFEIFAGTAETNSEILHRLRQSVEHWRRYVPEDGLPLDRLVASLD